MSKREWWRAVGAAAVTAVLVVGGAVAAHAAPTPDSGPEAGGTTVTVAEPAGVTFTSIEAGSWHSVAIGSDGNAYAWGRNDYAPLGDGTTTDSNFPVRVQAPPGVTFTNITAGGLHSVAIGSDGNTYAWGDNGDGQLGDGTNTSSAVPVQVQAPTGVTFTSLDASWAHSVAVGSDGNAYAWGYNGYGQLGDGTNNNSSNVPVQVQAPAGVTFTSVAAGSNHSVAFDSAGNVYAWGSNSSVPVLVQVPAGVTVTSISAGVFHSVAAGSDGKAYAWGYNYDGQLGDGTNNNSNNIPVLAQIPTGVTVTSVAAGNHHSAAVGSDGNTYAWGRNDHGQLGDGTTTSSSAPVPVQAPAGVTFTSIAAGDMHSVATGSDGNTYAWGYNGFGALGDGTNTDSSVPVQVQALSVVVTSVSFDGIPGTNLVDNGDGTWSVDTPAHTAGSVDVVVSWTLGGTAQTPITHPNGFTYTPTPVAPTITNPGNQSVTAGGTATFTVTATGTPTPAVTWEVSHNRGLTWRPISTDPAATPSSDGLTLTVVARLTHNGYQYRATADNGVGTPATSQGASLTVTLIPATQCQPNPWGHTDYTSIWKPLKPCNTHSLTTPLSQIPR